MSYHDVNFNNLKIKFDKAISKTLGGGEDKRIHGYNWYDLTRVQNIFKSYSQKINLHEKFKPIIEYTNIASIHLEYNGYGDDGCLEGVEFLDKNGELNTIHYPERIRIKHINRISDNVQQISRLEAWIIYTRPHIVLSLTFRI